jgi:CRISPR-associated protein Cas5d
MQVNRRTQSVKVIISAPLGHFQRPGNPGEPSTYPLITPTAVEGVINAVSWHPGHSVQVKSIAVLNPIEYTTETVTQHDHSNGDPWLRTYELLVNPRFLVDFWLECDADVDASKRIGLLARRLQSGQHYYQPTMGLSDFPAKVELLPKDAMGPPPQDLTFGVGQMPHYWRWSDTQKAGRKPFARRTTAMLAERPLIRSEGEAVMFNAKLINGVMMVDHYPKRGENGYAT